MRPQFTQADVIEWVRGQGWKIVKSKLAPATFAFTTIGERIHLKAWAGKAAKPSFYYTYRTLKAAEEEAKQFVENLRRREEIKAEGKAKRKALKASDHWTVGDVGYTSWGYDQTNVEFFQVTQVFPKSVAVRQIKRNCSDHGGPSGGKTAPCRNEFIGPEFRCPLDELGGFNAGPCFNGDKPQFRHHCSKWTGKAVYASSYH